MTSMGSGEAEIVGVFDFVILRDVDRVLEFDKDFDCERDVEGERDPLDGVTDTVAERDGVAREANACNDVEALGVDAALSVAGLATGDADAAAVATVCSCRWCSFEGCFVTH